MRDTWIKTAALWVSLLLCLCVLDGAHRGAAPGGSANTEQAPAEEFVLSVRIDVEGSKLAPSGAPTWETRLYLEVPTETSKGRPARAYEVKSTLKGTGPGAQTVKAPAGTYWIVARAPGFVRAQARLTLSKDTEVKLKLTPATPLLVKVLAEKQGDLTPLSGATVLVGEPGFLPHGARTDEKGEARFDALAAGQQRVRIFAPGFEPYEGLAERELLVRLRPVSTLRVHVKDGGVSEPDAEVFIAGAELWPARTVLTGGEGYVDLAGLRPGKYALYAEKDVRVSQVKSDVEVPAEPGLIEVTLALFPGTFVEAKVLAKDNEKPIEGARVTWSSSGLDQFSRHARTDGAGLVRIGPLREWGGMLQVRAEGFVPRMIEALAPEKTADDPSPPQIILLERAGTIEGRVVDAQGFPVEGATVEVAGTDLFGMPISIAYLSDEITDAHFDWANETQNVLIPAGELGVMLGPVPPIPLGEVTQSSGRRLSTDEKGYFVARNVPPGEMVVLARHPDHMDGKSPVLHLAPSGHVKTTVVLGRGEPLRGRVVDYRGFPVPHARVQISASGFDRRVTADTDGTFSASAAPVEVTLRISRIDQPLRVVFAREVTKKERGGEIEIKLPEPREPAEVTVVDEEDEPVRLAQVTVMSLAEHVPFKKTLFTDDEGKALFEEAAGLRVRLSLSAPGFVAAVAERTLKSSSTHTLTPSLMAEGRVTAVRGRRPASGARVTYRAGTVTRTTVADEEGHYQLSGLPPGAGKLSASHEEYGKGEIPVRLKRPDTDKIVELPDLDLVPTLEVSGRVEDENGDPLAGVFLSSARLSPYLPMGGAEAILGTSDENGEFTVEVQRQAPLYLYGAWSGRGYGFSDQVKDVELDRVSDVIVVIDRTDKIPPDLAGTVLLGIEDAGTRIVVYAVAEGSDAQRDGLRVDDVLLEVEDVAPDDAEHARELLSGLPGTDVRVSVRRGGQQVQIYTSRENFFR